MDRKVRIHIDDDRISVSLPNGSPFLEGMHRIFLSNVIGLEELEEDNKIGYTLESTKGRVSDIIIELLEYFKTEGGEVELDVDSQNIVTAYSEGVVSINDAREAGRLLKENPPKSIDVPNFKRTLKPYQIAPVAHMIEVQNAANFSVPGSGKTSITLAGYSILKVQGIVDKMVVVAPRSAFMSWEDEFEACIGDKQNVVRITGPIAVRRRLYRKAATAELILLSYQMVNFDTNRLAAFMTDHRVLLILDESHYIKRMEGGKWSSSVISIAPLATRRVILTGTPVPNSLEDLRSQMTFLWPNPNILGTTNEYRDRLSSLDVHAASEIREQLRPFYWRIHKSQLGLKKPKYHRIKVKMRPYQKAIYDTLAAKVLAESTQMPEERLRLRAWRRSRMIRLLQVASNPSLLATHSKEFMIPPMDATGLPVSDLINDYPRFEFPPKIAAAVELTEKLIGVGEKVLIWTSFIHNIITLEDRLAQYSPRVVYGDIPKDTNENEQFNREKMIREFKNSTQYNILIANPSACAESVSLHKSCHHAIYVDRTFNCAQYMQSLDRIHRIGLKADEQVHYHILQCQDSIDEVIDTRLNEKHMRMLELLEDDFAVLDLEASFDMVSEDSEEEGDFQAILENLRSKYKEIS